MIEASLATQYGIRIRQHPDMPWDEFCNYVAGIMPETPLGAVVAIRAEKDPKAIRAFGPDQRRIHSEWRKRGATRKLDDPVKLDMEMQNFELTMARLFGGGGG
ncbi:hypothetical protein SAMN04487969_101131 [Paenibacillus algorifonticola]|uniref:Bacteriophage Gp15 protein n=1 Tax=Paenibacillus algorifonticola TaxID=684063 RepID=A0A1I1XVY9_9BACL|nr:hypothetical protein [Paenibacillus algorifonticola]SFE11507.1 hypothetical protein SAMN04487969_101131 [Paenibacillus algorifonticola]